MQDIAIRKQVHFGTHDGHALTADYYGPQCPGSYPALVTLHGGGWKLGSSDSDQYWGHSLAGQGYALFSVNYRLVQGVKNRYPAAVHDARAAVQFLRSNSEEFQVDPDRLGLMGASAGAHLSALVALAGDAPPFSELYQDDP